MVLPANLCFAVSIAVKPFITVKEHRGEQGKGKAVTSCISRERSWRKGSGAIFSRGLRTDNAEAHFIKPETAFVLPAQLTDSVAVPSPIEEEPDAGEDVLGLGLGLASPRGGPGGVALAVASPVAPAAGAARGLGFQPPSGFQAGLGAPAGPSPDGAAPVPRPFTPRPYLPPEPARCSADPAADPNPATDPAIEPGAASPRAGRAAGEAAGGAQEAAAGGGAGAAHNPGADGAELPAGIGWRMPGLAFALPVVAAGGGGPAVRLSAEDAHGDAERSLGSVSSVEVRNFAVGAAACAA